MHLKRLEIVGFKSFAEKTKLNFEPGITVIVGPNGCGKSNILDSIKWVLGEQSVKSLRASRMEDVIFNGASNIEPLNFAEVSLVLSNDDKALPIEYDEVTITRRIYRTGETEYLLNKTTVRLKDITELLMGTGIGVDSYSFLEQGKMDLIISSKPEDRRYVFEEASGITKYKSKKKEALRKLEQTEENLIRINDIITEVRRQINSIERHAQKAEKYKIVFEELKEKEVKVTSYKHRELKNESKILNVESDDLTVKLNELGGILEQFETKRKNFRCDLENITNLFTNTQNKLTEAVTTIDKNSHTISNNELFIKDLESLVVSLAAETENLKEKISTFTNAFSELRSQLTEITTKCDGKTSLVLEKEHLLQEINANIKNHEKNIKDSENFIIDCLSNQTKAKNESLSMEAEIKSKNARISRLKLDMASLAQQLQEAKISFDEVNNDYEAKKKEADKKEEILKSKQGELEGKKQVAESIKEEILDKKIKASSYQAKLEFLKSSVLESGEYAKNTKKILELSKGIPGFENIVLGLVCDVINADGYLTRAIEYILGWYVFSPIVRTREDAKKIVRHLGDTQAAANFFILDEFSDSHVSHSLENISAIIDSLNVKNGFQGLVKYLFNEVYLVDNLGDAEHVIYGLNNDVIVVTRDGYICERGRFIKIDRNNTVSAILGREAKIKQTEENLALLNNDVLDLSKKLATEELNYSNYNKLIDSENDNLRRDQIELNNVESKRKTILEYLERLKQENEIINLEKEDTESSIKKYEERMNQLVFQIEDFQNQYEKLNQSILDSKQYISENASRREGFMVEISVLRTESESLRREQTRLSTENSKQDYAFKQMEEELVSKSQKQTEYSERIVQLKEDIAKLTQDNIRLENERVILHNESEETKLKRIEVVTLLDEIEKQYREQETTVVRLREELNKINIKLTENSYKQKSLCERILQAYKIDLEQIDISQEHEEEDVIDFDVFEAEINELKEKLEKLGPVNLVAIEEHEQLQERFNFLSKQQEDLSSAKENLMKAIQKINRTTKELFMETFIKVQGEFKNFFKMLFGGGHAELLLLDDNDVLESGIEIIVRPPGKRLQNISLLSGGEKALTATALLFALFTARPSPFCVLDELDAPLDETNIGRFSNILKTFLNTTQFIMISHNKKTIQLADVMYGITMEQTGISKVVSVRLKQRESEVSPQASQPVEDVTQTSEVGNLQQNVESPMIDKPSL